MNKKAIFLMDALIVISITLSVLNLVFSNMKLQGMRLDSYHHFKQRNDEYWKEVFQKSSPCIVKEAC